MKKIAISINLDWPLKRYHDVYYGIQEYNQLTNWCLVWDHFPENYLKKSPTDKPYYDGIIGRIKYEAYSEATRLGIPLVNTWTSSSLVDTIPSVLVDYKEAGRLAAKYLIKRGFQNFVNIDGRSDKGCKDFFEGFAEIVKPRCNGILKRHLFNRKCDESAEQWEIFHNNFASWTKHWKYPIGIISASSSVGPRVTTRLLEHGIKIPEEAVVLTLDNELIYCEGRDPQISSIEIDYFAVGYEAARLMDLQLNGKPLKQQTILIPPDNVVTRDSTDTYPISDKFVKAALSFIAENFDKNIGIVDILKKVPIGRRSLEIKFNQMIGHSIGDELNQLKVRALKKLLLNSDEKINTLYQHVGFNSDQNMRRVFKKITGLSPAEFRESKLS